MQQSQFLDLPVDVYNSGPTIELLENKLAALLGKEKALFMHKGMAAQHCALMYWSNKSSSKKIAIHPQSHMHVDEALAYQHLLGLEAVMFGKHNQAFSSLDIAALPADLSCICVELPLRRAGFKLPEWQHLIDLKAYSTKHNIPLHIDGARLFEAACHFDKPYAELAALGDSIYVSLYKILGAAAGAVIAGDADFIEGLKPWRSRIAGDLPTVFPYILTALWGLEHYLPRVPEFYQRAVRLANKIELRLGPQAIPNPIQSTGFLVELPLTTQALEQKALALAQQEKICLFERVIEYEANASRFEIQVGDALDEWQDEEVIDILQGFLTLKT